MTMCEERYACAYAKRWPELWETLTRFEQWTLSQTLADDPPCNPRRDEIADLADYVAGRITDDEYEQRAECRLLGIDSPGARQLAGAYNS